MEINKNNYGVCAYGLKTGIITCDDNIIDVVKKTLEKNQKILDNEDIICITEAVVAITQKNFISLNDVSKEIKEKLNLKEDSTIAVVYSILSRNRFSMILKAIAKAVPKGKVIVQLLFVNDEQGNPITTKEILKKINKGFDDIINVNDLEGNRFLHPETGMDYIKLYEDIIKEQGANAEVYLANSTRYIVEKNPNGIIVSNVHERFETLEKIKEKGFDNVITLQDIYSDDSKEVFSEFGILGSNILDPVNETLKLSPKKCNLLCEEIKLMIKKEFDKDVEVIINGDGAYKDPESGIYELADPVSAFGCTKRIENNNRLGVKTKYLMQKLYNEGKSKEEIEEHIKKEKEKLIEEEKKDNFSAQGTTPRKIKNLVSSLADLVTGSGDDNTPIVLVKGFL